MTRPIAPTVLSPCGYKSGFKLLPPHHGFAPKVASAPKVGLFKKSEFCLKKGWIISLCAWLERSSKAPLWREGSLQVYV
ncbi:hypothetical protein ES703_72121 [subsurface metagenome]